MKENNTDSKLEHKLEPKKIRQTGTSKNSASQTARPRFKIKFTDYATEKFVSSFINERGKTQYRKYTPFDISKDTKLKGLRLCQYEESKEKYFVLQIWYQGKSYKITIGKFIPGVFGTKECEEKVFEIAREHQNDKGIWIKNPQLTIRDKETKIVKAVIIESQKLTINQVIERYVAAGFPRKKGKTKRGSSIKRDCLNLLGHNWRTKHLIFDDVNGKGVVHFKANSHKRTAKPDSWSDLFSKFPPGHGILKDNYFNPKNERSVYDNDLGKLVIDELTPGIVERYLEAKERSPGTKKSLLDSINSVWLFARKKGWLGDTPNLNPCRQRDGGIVIDKSEAKADPYKDR